MTSTPTQPRKPGIVRIASRQAAFWPSTGTGTGEAHGGAELALDGREGPELVRRDVAELGVGEVAGVGVGVGVGVGAGVGLALESFRGGPRPG